MLTRPKEHSRKMAGFASESEGLYEYVQFAKYMYARIIRRLQITLAKLKRDISVVNK